MTLPISGFRLATQSPAIYVGVSIQRSFLHPFVFVVWFDSGHCHRSPAGKRFSTKELGLLLRSIRGSRRNDWIGQ